MKQCSVIVIGAGAAGLAAAQKLQQNHVDVVVLEARNRLGGRVHTDRTFGAFPIELGAELIHGEQTVTLELVRQGGLAVSHVDRVGKLRWGSGGSAQLLEDSDPVDRQIINDLIQTYRQLPDLMPAEAQDCSLANFFQHHGFDDAAIRMADVLFAQTCCASIETLSAADLAREMRVDHAGHQEFRIDSGYASFFEWLAADLRVELNMPVDTIEWGTRGVIVTTAHERWHAEHCIVTVPIGVLQASLIRFDPPLSTRKQTAIDAFRLERATKHFFRFKRRLWDADLTFMAHTGLFARWWTPGYPREDATILCSYISAQRAATADALDDATLLQHGLSELSQLLGVADLAAELDGFQRMVWGNDPYARGGYAHVPPHAVQARVDLAAPESNCLFFAGEATAYDTNPQTVHGAIESGWRAAREVLSQETPSN
jgi:monoamine oxidase